MYSQDNSTNMDDAAIISHETGNTPSSRLRKISILKAPSTTSGVSFSPDLEGKTTAFNWNPSKASTFGSSPRPTRESVTSMASSEGANSEIRVAQLPRTKRCQRRLSVLLHTHVVLILVCTLSILDAVCVIGQLICDILIIREKLDFFQSVDDQLTIVLLPHLPYVNQSIHEKWNLHAILSVLTGTDPHYDGGPFTTPGWPSMDANSKDVQILSNMASSFQDHMAGVQDHHLHRVRRAVAEPKVPGHEVEHGILYDLTHACHQGSMAILSILLIETLLKVFAMGRKLRHHKLEIFDALVVTISWSLDVAFWEGIWANPGTVGATMLIYFLPWRVVRIVNSFILVIQEKDHVQLKILKQRLRMSTKKSKDYSYKNSSLKHEVKALAGLCRKMGATESDITACSPSGRPVRLGSVHSVLERAASLTFISTMSSMGSVPSLFDMGDFSSDDEDVSDHSRDLTRKVSHDPTVRSAFSTSTHDSGSAIYSIQTECGTGLENSGYDDDGAASPSPSQRSFSKSELERKESQESAISSQPPSYTAVFSGSDWDGTRL